MTRILYAIHVLSVSACVIDIVVSCGIVDRFINKEEYMHKFWKFFMAPTMKKERMILLKGENGKEETGFITRESEDSYEVEFRYLDLWLVLLPVWTICSQSIKKDDPSIVRVDPPVERGARMVVPML